LAIWRWEVNDKNMLSELKDRVEARVESRKQVFAFEVAATGYQKLNM
jgi:hypothetical protein